ncbi:MAG: bifunctional 2-polyprenyl-6-hydroxyphenol methylase/3-demethylubiquinol 3-O-methyltransferase UbiG [Gammaproteobacteria bacterium]|nr:bifunctional 2-polyprenyl-6-hydroxyphenol methylase/3-demethylubiquinol 3-O-methyltransferase UbiG [Gammaproteobacteria bacterium]
MTAIASELERFDRLSSTWWNPSGPMRPLHVMNELRLAHLLDRIALHFGRDNTTLAGLRVLDVGCGGGLLSEPLAQRGAEVVGIDASRGNVFAAKRHAQSQGVTLDYRLGEPCDVLQPAELFDVVLALEVVEHVADVADFISTAARHVAPGGLLLASTIDRTWKSFVFAIIGAEYVLRLLPRGTHQWQRFVRPGELAAAATGAGLRRIDLRGMRYLPIWHRASWSRDTRVNYMATFVREAN